MLRLIMIDRSYPIGRFEPPSEITAAHIETATGQIARLPVEIRAAVRHLQPEQLNQTYRPGGWTGRQVVHHVADSHMNAYVRFRLALTEDNPTIKPYDEKRWAELADARSADVEVSLALLDHLHERWGMLLKSLAPEDYRRTYTHPEYGLRLLSWNVLLYGWHGRHHVAHIGLLAR